MRRVHFYNKESGLFNGHSLSSNLADADRFARLVASNCPAGHDWKEGHFDHLSQKVNVLTGEIEEYRPTRPSLDHEWNHVTKRWDLSAAASSREAQQADARRQIAELESQCHSLMRRVVLENDAQARAQLSALHAQIDQLRKKL